MQTQTLNSHFNSWQNSFGMKKREKQSKPLILFNGLHSPLSQEKIISVFRLGYTGIVFDFESYQALSPFLEEEFLKVISLCDTKTDSISSTLEILDKNKASSSLVLASSNSSQLEELALKGFQTGYRAYVTDSKTLHEAIQIGKKHSFLFLRFKDPTNIPLELVIASLQSSNTVLIKEIAKDDEEDAIVTLGVMEVGAEGILSTFSSEEKQNQFLERVKTASEKKIELQEGEIISTKPIGMGHRSCIDLTTLFTEEEGMLVGSTSQGGILCCPEVFYLPYMELRPFRVNAGAVHSYVYNLENRTDYMTELKAGSPVMIVGTEGKTRRSYVGRIKTEIRPLRLIEVSFLENKKVNILLQDDWHVRVFSADRKPRNITELKKGDRLLGWVGEPGRHVGISVSENILET